MYPNIFEAYYGFEARPSPPFEGYYGNREEEVYRMGYLANSLPAEYMDTQSDYSSTENDPPYEVYGDIFCDYLEQQEYIYLPHPFDVVFEGTQYPQMDDFYASSSSPGSSEGTVSSPATSVASIIPDPQTIEELHSYIFNPTVEATIITEQMARIKIRNKIRHVCKICRKDYSNCSNLKNHIHTKHYGNRVPWECVTCNKRFSSQTSARRHKKSVGASRMTCPHCHKTVSRKDYLKGYHATACKGVDHDL